MLTTARLAHQSLRFDAAVQTHLVVSLTAPPLDAGARRPPVCVIPVVDVSGSMEGDKLFMAKQSLLKLVDHLGPEDRCGVVAFSTEVQVVAPARAMTPDAKAALKLRIGDLEPLANTNLSGGLLGGLQLGNGQALPPEVLVRVILFTDGQANAGLATTAAQLLPLLDAHRGRASVSAFGYGHDADQELLSDLARRGAGNYAFIDGPDAALGAFGRELGGLLSTSATDLTVRVTPAPGAAVTSVLSDVSSRLEGGALVLSADDILAEEERHLVLEVALAPRQAPETVPAFQVELSWTARQGGGTARQAAAHAVAVDRVEPPLAQQRPDPDLDVLVAQAQLLAAQLEAEALARAGRHGQAVAVLYQVAHEVEARGHGEVGQAARTLGDKMRDRQSYDSSAHMRKSMQSAMRRSSTSGEEGESRRLLDRMGKKTRTKAQEDMDAAFQGSATPPGSAPPPSPATPGRPRRPSASGGPERRRSRRW